jgi:hypothetical protein
VSTLRQDADKLKTKLKAEVKERELLAEAVQVGAARGACPSHMLPWGMMTFLTYGTFQALYRNLQHILQ